MNKTVDNCYSNEIKITYLTSSQQFALTLINSILMTASVMANGLVIYVLIKSKQISNITCKLIFMLSVLDLLQGIFIENLLTAFFYETKCSVTVSFLFLSVFFMHLSGYTIAAIGADRYLRIKYYVKFKSIWTTKVALTLICTGYILAFFQAAMITGGLVLKRQQYVTPVYVAMDGIVIGTIVFLQIQTIRVSNAVYNGSTVVSSQRTNKKITKLSTRIMLLLCFFFAPHTLILNILRNSKMKDQLNLNEKSTLEFIACISLIFVFVNSFANAVLFLTTNMKARRIFRNFLRK